MIYHLYAESKNNYINGLIYKTEIDSQTQKKKKNYGYQRGKGGRDKLRVWDEQIQTTMYKIGKKQRCTVQHKEL